MVKEKECYLINEAAREVQVESHVLRYWEDELGLPIKRNGQGHRIYSREDVDRFIRIKSLKDQGLQLKAVKTVLEDLNDMGDGTIFPDKAEGVNTIMAVNRSMDMDKKVVHINSKEKNEADERNKEDALRKKNLESLKAIRKEFSRTVRKEREHIKAHDNINNGKDKDTYKGINNEKNKAGDTSSAVNTNDKNNVINDAVNTNDKNNASGESRTADTGLEAKQELMRNIQSHELQTDNPQTEKFQMERLQYLFQKLIGESVQAGMSQAITESVANAVEIAFDRRFDENGSFAEGFAQTVTQSISETVRQDLCKELDYQFRVMEEREDERNNAKQNADRLRDEEYYKRIDELLRSYSSKGKKVKPPKRKTDTSENSVVSDITDASENEDISDTTGNADNIDKNKAEAKKERKWLIWQKMQKNKTGKIL